MAWDWLSSGFMLPLGMRVHSKRLPTQYYSNYNLRNSEGKLALPKPRTNYLKRSFSYRGDTLWNHLLSSLKNVGSVDQFKRNLKKVSSISDSHTAIM